MFYKNNFYIYLDARAGISHREDFGIIDTPESFRISRISFDSVQNTFKSKYFLKLFCKPFKCKPFKVYFQNSYFENTFFSEKHVVPDKMVWLKGGGF